MKERRILAALAIALFVAQFAAAQTRRNCREFEYFDSHGRLVYGTKDVQSIADASRPETGHYAYEIVTKDGFSIHITWDGAKNSPGQFVPEARVVTLFLDGAVHEEKCGARLVTNMNEIKLSLYRDGYVFLMAGF